MGYEPLGQTGFFKQSHDVTTCNLKMTLSVKKCERALTWGLFCALWTALVALGEPPAVRWVTDAQDSARASAFELLGLLQRGEIEAAARLSTAPAQRYDVLKAYRDSVGEQEFKRVYGRYFGPQNRLAAEAALGSRRLLIWDLGEAGNHLAGQFFIEVEGRYLLDDMPSAERAELERVLQAYRRQATR